MSRAFACAKCTPSRPMARPMKPSMPMACEVTQAVDENLRALQRLLVRVRTGGGVEDEQDPGDRERGGSHPDAVPVNDVIHDAQQSKTSCSSGVLFVKTVRIR